MCGYSLKTNVAAIRPERDQGGTACCKPRAYGNECLDHIPGDRKPLQPEGATVEPLTLRRRRM